MKQEIHKLKTHYRGVQPFVKVTAYELSAVDCSATDMSGYYGQETTLISDDPQPGYDFQSWSVTGSNVTGNNVKFQGDITAKANYSAHVYNVTLQNDGHGSIGANKTTGIIGDTITLSNTGNAGYSLDRYEITGSTLTGNQFNIGLQDVTAKGFFTAQIYTLTIQNDGHGTISASKLTGIAGDTVTLSNTNNTYYRFSGYSQTGGSLNGSTFTFGNQNATAKANFSANVFSASGGCQSAYVTHGGMYGQEASASAFLTASYKTSNVPAGWYTNNVWKPSNANSYKITINGNGAGCGTMSNGGTVSYKRGHSRLYCSNNTAAAALSASAAGSCTLTINNFTSNQQNSWYLWGYSYGYQTKTANRVTAYVTITSNVCTWTATGYAP